MKDFASTYALSWRLSPGAILIEAHRALESIEDMLSQNYQTYADGCHLDSFPLAFSRREHCFGVAEEVRKSLAERRASQSIPL